ncbi:HalOD1 output domain-containing protein [Haloterrigena alkaliphila]|uniref:Halobacterial output domain-containing protein n=1 Tax=Haloterrigena alkaliphila TaxID=2816475 RepID=A0A8A2VBE7_9EURY|nr:HalOD1 output domain-containing protein [Haloterrigena alkaliphila]QSW97764.1 hypothetical protein J0X25_10055 [Haloterrigena alkaliphila]
MNGLRSERPSPPAHRAHFDPTGSGQLSSAIVRAIVTATDRSPGQLTPLYEAIDPDALERLLEHAATSTVDAAAFGLEFSVDDLEVVVTGDGGISVYDCGDDPEPDEGTGSESGVEFEYEQ